MALAPLDVHHSADAAGVVLKLWIVQTKGVLLFCKVFHRLSHPFNEVPDRMRHPPQHSERWKKQKDAPQGQNPPLQNVFVPVLIIIPTREKSSSDSCTKSESGFAPHSVRNVLKYDTCACKGGFCPYPAARKSADAAVSCGIQFGSALSACSWTVCG